MDSIKPTSQKEAKKLGSKVYNTGKPCKFGNIADRLVNGRCVCRQCKDVVKEASKNWYKKTKPKRPFTETQRQRNSEWKKSNKDKVNALNANRRALKRNATPKWFSEFDEFVIQESYDLCLRREKTTGIRWSLDHMIPLKSNVVCGLHCASNIQVIPHKLNSSKRNNLIFTNPFDWLKNARI